ncbi:MAG TPA: hypothetical protein VF870_10380 [Ignavibacteriaceae bacterium]
MKTFIYLITAFIIYCSLIYANGGPPPAPPLFKAKNTGSVYQAPLITGKNQNIFWARFSYNAVSELDGQIKLEGTYTNTQATENGKNFEWQTPSTVINFGLSARVAESGAIVLNIGVGKLDSWELAGLEAAYCGLMVNKDHHKARLLLGINIHTTDFDWFTDSTNNSISKSGVEWDPALSIIYNSDFDDWIVNPYVQFSYSCQTLYDSDKEDYSTEVYRNVNVFSCVPGVTYRFNDNIMANLGTAITYVNNIENSKNLVITPQLQFSYYFMP